MCGVNTFFNGTWSTEIFFSSISKKWTCRTLVECGNFQNLLHVATGTCTCTCTCNLVFDIMYRVRTYL